MAWTRYGTTINLLFVRPLAISHNPSPQASAGFHPERIETTATATMENLAAGWTLTRIQLEVHANVPNASQALFMDAAVAAKTNCPIGRLLKTNISMIASLDV